MRQVPALGAVETLPPLVVLHGTADGTTRVKYAEEAVKWVKKAKGLGTPTTTVNAVSASYTASHSPQTELW